MCDCISYNRPKDYQKTKSVILRPPFPTRPAGEDPIPHKDVCIDACVVETIKQVWKAGIYTKSSCCGHNKRKPSIVVEESAKNGDFIRKKIAKVDSREWDIFSWILTRI